jgi:DinB family protein
VGRPHPPSAGTRTGPPAFQPAFATQRAHATLREELLFELARARAAVRAAIQGLTAANASRPIAPGKWTPLEIVLHLGERDRVRLEEFHRTLNGQPRTWAGISDAEQATVNEQHLAPLRALTWESAVRRLESLREQLLLRLHEVPALPDDVWKRGHTFAEMLWALPEHDRLHAEQIKRARTGEPVLTED